MGAVRAGRRGGAFRSAERPRACRGLRRFTLSPGFAAVVLLDESHLSAHCYADRGWLAIDCFTCGGTDAEGIVDDVLNAFMADMPSLVVRQRVVLDRFLHPKEE